MKTSRTVKTLVESLSGFSEDFMSERKQPPVQSRLSTVDEMKLVPFSSAFDVMSDAGKRVKQRDYLPEGKIPVIDQGQAFIGGYTNEQDFLYGGSLPVIIFGDHTKKIKLVNQPFAVGADGVKILKSKPEFVPKFLYYFLQIVDLPNKGYARHFQFLRKSEFPYIKLERQKEIVSEIEKQFSRLDEAVAGLKRIKANLKRYKASVLKAAVEGKLTEEWRSRRGMACHAPTKDETGEALLKRILVDRKKKWEEKNPGKKYKEPIAPDTSGLPELPKGWVWATVDQLVEHLSDGDHQPPPQTEEGIPFLVIGNVRSGQIDFTNSRFVGEGYYNKIDPYRQPKKGDLLYTLVGSYGIPIRVKTSQAFCIQRHMAILRPHEISPMDYLTISMATSFVFSQATNIATGTAQKTVPLAGLRKIAIPLPPSAEQQRVVAEVDRHLSIIGEVEAQVEANLKRAERLRQSILKKAFCGELGLKII